MARAKHGGLAGLMIGLAWVSGPLAAAQLPSSGLGPLEGGPRIEVAEPIHDFGRLPPGDSRQHEFVYRNVGSVPLEIKQVRTSCGCTTAGEWDRQVEPGAAGRVAIKFDTANYSGALQRNVTLVTNDPRQPQLVLQVKAQIWAPIEVNPKTVMFQYDSEATEGETRVVRLTSHLDEPLAFASVRSEHPGFRATLETMKARPGIRPANQHGAAGGNRDDHHGGGLGTGGHERGAGPGYGLRPGTSAPDISPVSLVLPAGQVRPGTRPSVTIRNNTSQPLELSDPSINLEGVEVEVARVAGWPVFHPHTALSGRARVSRRPADRVDGQDQPSTAAGDPGAGDSGATGHPTAGGGTAATRTNVLVRPPAAPPPPARAFAVDR
jgi:hypothetical protein